MGENDAFVKWWATGDGNMAGDSRGWLGVAEAAWTARASLSHPTPVQGEPLPVVGYIDHDAQYRRKMGWIEAFIVYPWRGSLSNPEKAITLTDHAQATAEIAKRDAVIEFHSKTLELIARQDIPALQTELTTLRTQLSSALAESGEMRGLLRESVAWIRNSQEPAPSLCASIDAALARHTTTQESAE